MCTAYFLNSHICQRNVTHEVSTCHTQTLPHHKMPMHPSLLKLLGQTHLEFLAKQVFFLDPATIHYPSKCWSSMQTTFKIRTDKNKFGKTKTYPNRFHNIYSIMFIFSLGICINIGPVMVRTLNIIEIFYITCLNSRGS